MLRRVLLTNAPAGSFYIGVKCESSGGAEFGLVALGSEGPFSQMDDQGNVNLQGLPLQLPIPDATEMPNFLEVQLKSYEDFLQANVPPSKRAKQGLQEIFLDIFPVTDIHENFSLEFKSYSLGEPKYSVAECEERGLTYAVPVKAKLRLSQKAENGKEYVNTIEQDVYLGNLPTMTHRGTFIINGAERVVVSQLHRSPGVFFSESIHPNGTPIYSARIIPFRGSWVEFTTDINNIMYAYIDRKKKFPVTTLLRALERRPRV